MTPKPRKLTGRQALALAVATVAVGKLKAELDEASERLKTIRARYKPLVPPSDEPDDAGKDVRQVKAGGFLIRVSTFEGGDYFSLKDYREAGHKITPEMREHIHAGDPRERWTVKSLNGPKRPDAVEPA